MLHVWLNLRDDGTLEPRTEYDRLQLRRLGPGKFMASVFQPRNKKLDNKFHAVMHDAFNQQGRFTDYNRFRAYVTVRAGHAEVWEFPSEAMTPQAVRELATVADHTFAEPMENGIGVRIMAPLSIKSLDGAEFSDFYSRALDVLVVDFGLDVGTLEKVGVGI